MASRRLDQAARIHLYDPVDPISKMFFTVLATFGEFAASLLHAHTRRGMAIARANGELKGKPPQLNPCVSTISASDRSS
jgi:DNA invertase Pin-like site-specific DNA recombinase